MVDGIRISGYGPESEVAHEEVDGVQYPIAKQAFGPDGQAITVDSNNPLPVQVQAPVDLQESDSTTQRLAPIDSPAVADFLESVVDQPRGLLVNAAPMGLNQPGQQLVAQSVPVALACEQYYDSIFIGAPRGAGPGGMVGANFLSLNPAGGPAIEVTQFRSIGMQINGGAGAAGAVAFEGSNDGVRWSFMYMYDTINYNAVPVNNINIISNTSRHFYGALPFRFFRVRVSTVLSGGPSQVIARLSMAPFIPSATLHTSLTGVGGYGVVSAGANGLLAVGGNIAPGTAPTAYPLPIGGVESFPASMGTPKTRRILTDNFGNLTVAGVDPTLSASAQPVLTKDAISGTGMDTADLLFRILVELRTISFLLQETPTHLNQGRNITGDLATEFTDEVRIQN